MKIKLLIEYLGFCLLLFTTQFNKPLYLSKSDYLYELSIAAEAFQRTGQQVFRTVTKNIETNPLDGYPRLDKVQQRHNETKVFMIAHWDFHSLSHLSKEIKSLYSNDDGHGLQTSGEEIPFTARPKINSHFQLFWYSRSIFCLPNRPKFSDFFDLCLHWVSVVRVQNHHLNSSTTHCV